MRICVIDGQGGGIGSTIIRKLREVFDESVEIVRANRGASGENAIVRTVSQADLVVAPVGIVMAHAMMGEVTPKIAEAVAACPAKKFLLPVTQENVEIVGLPPAPLPPLIETLIEEHLKELVFEDV
jgi:hypothetical protein